MPANPLIDSLAGIGSAPAGDKPAHHRTPVVRITEIIHHPGADALDIIPVLGYQAIVRKGDYQVGDLACYLFPDSLAPLRPEFEFLWKDRISDGEQPQTRHRRIAAKKLRKEWSEGLLMPLTKTKNNFGQILYTIDGRVVLEGDDVSDLLGVEHYNPPEPGQSTKGENERGPVGKKWPRSFKGWLFFLLQCIGIKVNGNTGGFSEAGPRFPVYDVENFKNFPNVFTPEDRVVVTEKIHGSNGRFVYVDNLLGKGKLYVGSRNLWKSLRSRCVWRKVVEQHSWITEWCKNHPGYALYGEVVPTQKSFDYGCKDGETKFFVFDILDPSGNWVSFETIFSAEGLKKFAAVVENWAPVHHIGMFDEARTRTFVDGKAIYGDHIKEGIVIKSLTEGCRIRGLGRKQLKLVSNSFLMKDNG